MQQSFGFLTQKMYFAFLFFGMFNAEKCVLRMRGWATLARNFAPIRSIIGLWTHISKSHMTDHLKHLYPSRRPTVSLAGLVVLASNQLMADVLQPSGATLGVGGNENVIVFHYHVLC